MKGNITKFPEPTRIKKESIYDIYFNITEECIQKYGEQTILFYQVGAFFEMYGVQEINTKNIIKSKIEHFTQVGQLNTSSKEIDTNDGSILMAGFRDYSLEKYIKIATSNDYTAVVYIQNMSNPKLITREFHGVFSPGTFISYDTDSSPQLSNNIVCLWISTYKPIQTNTKQLVCGISSAHIFTGESTLYEYETPFLSNPTTFDELERSISLLAPSECIIISFISEKETADLLTYAGLSNSKTKNHIYIMDSENNIEKKNIIDKCQKQTFINHQLSTCFGTESYQICQEFSHYPTATQSFCYLLNFIQERNPDLIKKMKIPNFLNSENRVRLANHTLQQLNIVDDDSFDGKRSGKLSSVASFLNQCCTPMGKRTMYKQITNPTSNIEWLESEYSAINSFMTISNETINSIRKDFRTIRDLEKICRQTVVQKVYPNTIFHLYESISIISQWMDWFSDKEHLKEHLSFISPINDFISFLSSIFFIDRCKGIDSLMTFQENLFRPGNFYDLDIITQKYQDYQSLFNDIHKTLNKIMRQKNNDETEYIKIHETEKSGSSLQITKKRGETLRNLFKDDIIINSNFTILVKDIRFVKASGTNDSIEFPQLTTLVKNIQRSKELWSNEIAKTFSYFLRTFENEWYERLEQWIQWTIRVDVLQSKAYTSHKYGYCRPSIQKRDRAYVDIKGLRHILIEHLQQNEVYVSNDIDLSSSTSQNDGILLFGTNAVGKTSLIRSVGICVILAQSGFYVPCSSFVFQPYTSIFSRILGNDNLFKGLSTFAVEMSELRVILKSADQHSLVLGDELCSGTEMESALSLFSAGLIELCKRGATFLFATHFHEITQYQEIIDLNRLGLKHMTVRYDQSSQALIYDRLLKEGQGTRMYGLEVCRSLFMDQDFLNMAHNLRNKYFPDSKGELGFKSSVYNSKKIRSTCEICKVDMATETHHLAPQKDADHFGYIDDVKGMFHKNHSGNLASVCENCHLKTHNNNIKLVKKKSTNGYILTDL